MTPALAMLGIARKAGAVQIGEEAATEAVLSHKARLILIAGDTGDSTRERTMRHAGEKLPVLVLAAGKEELGSAVGLAAVAVVTLTDLNFASSVAAKLAAEDPQYEEAAQSLHQRQQKAQRRRADTVKNGKKSSRRK